MLGAGLASRAHPGVTDPLAGVGDQAVMMGPAAMIRTGNDLVTIVLSGVESPIAKVRAIFSVAKPRIWSSFIFRRSVHARYAAL